MKKRFQFVHVLPALFFGMLISLPLAFAEEPPNILFIMVDDLARIG